jgi:hypothetical protein
VLGGGGTFGVEWWPRTFFFLKLNASGPQIDGRAANTGKKWWPIGLGGRGSVNCERRGKEEVVGQTHPVPFPNFINVVGI